MSRRDDSKHRGREGYESHRKERNDEKVVRDQRKRYDDTESKRSKGVSHREDVSKVTTTSDERESSSSKKIQQGRMEDDVNAAKTAALGAAESVNRNIAGAGSAGYMTTDQKRKLLWGNKKNTAAEEVSHRWDTALFPDQERQEKFKKLMGVKSEAKLEQNPNNQEGTDILRAEKQKELQQELEKQYTAGLRRRDGRTVGLGL